MNLLELMFALLLKSSIIQTTIDMNLSEIEYLADHLHPEECRRLVAALHFNSYDLPNALDSGERKVDEDIPCLKLLLHWNSAKGEGRGETHEIVQHRLRQIGREDLADWLGKTVFHQLGRDLTNSLNKPFQNIINSTEANNNYNQRNTNSAIIQDGNDSQWLPFDTICWILLFVLMLIAIFILARVVCILCCKCGKKKRNRAKHDINQERYCNVSDSESECKFDCRQKDDAATKLLGVQDLS